MHAKLWPLCDIQDELCPDPQYLLQHHKPISVEFAIKLLSQVEHWQVASHTRRDHTYVPVT